MSNVNEMMAPVWVNTITSEGVPQQFLMDRIKADLLNVEGAVVDFLPVDVQGGIVPVMKVDGKGNAMMSDNDNLGQSLIHLITGRKGMFSYASKDKFDLRQSNLISRKQLNTYFSKYGR